MGQRRPPVMSVALMWGNTERAATRCKDLAKLAVKVADDTEKAQRLERQRCKACHYFKGIGGAAITTQPCMRCGKEQTYGSTNTDALCMDCATHAELCKHCGGDLEMRTRRRGWPHSLIEPKED